MANEIYKSSWWGSPVDGGWGGIYYDLAQTLGLLELRYIERVEADGGVVESTECLKSTWSEYNWKYAFRVTDDGGVVESLECVTL